MRSHAISICGTVALTLAGMVLLISSAGLLSAEPQNQAEGPIVRFTATTDNIVDSHDPIRIDLIGWSNDAERNQLTTAWTQALARAAAIASKHAAAGTQDARAGSAPKASPPNSKNAQPIPGVSGPLTPQGSLYAALEKQPTLGYIWPSSEISGYTVRYAAQLPQPEGGQRIVLITDRRLGDQNGNWNLVGAPAVREAAAIAERQADNESTRPNQYDQFSIIELRLDSKGRGEGKISVDYNVDIDNSSKTLELPDYKDLPVVLRNVKRLDSPSRGKES